ncbi:hypothetical protein J437_LFUL011633 [Ladona fulva]|uniref:Uncharacterized protein n=1 Tax=Ladona fulva TaxID=123851 RepID=A0A8K0NZH9_LADFU|nr:hypothetical protein J437_LFUL011633 [Ladona fulva]
MSLLTSFDDNSFHLSRSNLANNVFPSLPPHSTGWERLLHLKTFNNPALREIPPPQHFPRVQTLVLSYAYHCCAFLPDGIPPPSPKRTEGPTPSSFPASHGGMGGARPPLKETVLFPSPDADFDLSLWNSSHTDIWPQIRESFRLLLGDSTRWRDS